MWPLQDLVTLWLKYLETIFYYTSMKWMANVLYDAVLDLVLIPWNIK